MPHLLLEQNQHSVVVADKTLDCLSNDYSYFGFVPGREHLDKSRWG